MMMVDLQNAIGKLLPRKDVNNHGCPCIVHFAFPIGPKIARTSESTEAGHRRRDHVSCLSLGGQHDNLYRKGQN